MTTWAGLFAKSYASRSLAISPLLCRFLFLPSNSQIEFIFSFDCVAFCLFSPFSVRLMTTCTCTTRSVSCVSALSIRFLFAISCTSWSYLARVAALEWLSQLSISSSLWESAGILHSTEQRAVWPLDALVALDRWFWRTWAESCALNWGLAISYFVTFRGSVPMYRFLAGVVVCFPG